MASASGYANPPSTSTSAVTQGPAPIPNISFTSRRIAELTGTKTGPGTIDFKQTFAHEWEIHNIDTLSKNIGSTGANIHLPGGLVDGDVHLNLQILLSDALTTQSQTQANSKLIRFMLNVFKLSGSDSYKADVKLEWGDETNGQRMQASDHSFVNSGKWLEQLEYPYIIVDPNWKNLMVRAHLVIQPSSPEEFVLVDDCASQLGMTKKMMFENGSCMQGVFPELYGDNRIPYDLVIICQEAFTLFHKELLLSRGGPVFSAKIEPLMAGNQLTQMDLSNFIVPVIQDFQSYVYFGRVPRVSQHPVDFFMFANEYQIEEIKDLAELEMCVQLTKDNFKKFHLIASTYETTYLKNEIIQFFKSNGSIEKIADDEGKFHLLANLL